jgi:hypothetical protein
MSTPSIPRPPGTPGPEPSGAAGAGSGPAAAGRNPAVGSTSSHYELLELSPAATTAELRQAFRRLSKRYHPDTTTLPPPQAEEAFRRLQLAYAVLSDPLQRNRYDTLLQGAGVSPGASRAAAAPARSTVMAESPRAVGVRRALSGGEWFALLLLGLALVLSLVLGIGVAWARGTALVRSPSWWADGAGGMAIPGPASASDTPAASGPPPTQPVQPVPTAEPTR